MGQQTWQQKLWQQKPCQRPMQPQKTWPEKTWPQKTWPQKTWIDVVTLGLCLAVGLGTALWDPQWQAGAQPTPAASELTEEQVTLFAKVVLRMEPLRQEAQQQANATTDEVTRDQIRRDFLRKATTIMNEQGLSVPEYNRIALKIRSPEGRVLKQQIEQEIINLQQVPPPTP